MILEDNVVFCQILYDSERSSDDHGRLWKILEDPAGPANIYLLLLIQNSITVTLHVTSQVCVAKIHMD